MRYQISNGATRDFAFQTVAGLRIVARGETAEVDMPEPMSEARLADLRRKRVDVAEAHAFTEAVSAPQTAFGDGGAFHSVEPVKPVTRKRGRPRKAKT